MYAKKERILFSNLNIVLFASIVELVLTKGLLRTDTLYRFL